MSKQKSGIILLLVFCVAVTIIGIVLLRELDPEKLQVWLAAMGIWAPILDIPHSAHLLSHKRLWLGTLRKLSGQTNELITGLQDIIST